MGPRAVAARISRAKNEMQTPGEYAAAATDFTEERTAKIYSIYQERLQASHAVDFDDLLMLTVLLFRDHAHVLEYYQNLWRYVLVDEYQDTNHAQYQLVNFLSRRHGNLCVVGDDDQSIYRWRGADLDNILDFERDHPGCRVIKLEQNYRSTQNILDAAGGVVGEQPGPEGEGALDRESGRRADRRVPGAGRAGRGGVRRRSASESWRPRTGARWTTSPSSTGPTPSRGSWKTRCGAT